MLGFLNAPMGAAYLIVTTIAHVLTTPLGAGLATAAAIIVFTAAVRLLLSPLSYHAFRGQARISALQPRIAALRARYAHQPDRLQQELTALYRAHLRDVYSYSYYRVGNHHDAGGGRRARG